MNFIKNYCIPFLTGSIIGTCVYAFYVETGPGMGKIFIRPGSNGELVFTINGFINLATEPLRNINLWKPQNLDINYIFVVTISGLCGILTKKFLL